MFDYVSKERRRLRGGTRSFAREVDIGDARIFVDHGFQWDGTKNVWITRARASYVLGSGPIFELKPRALLARVTGFLGGTPSGDPCFDDFFTVRTGAAEETWSALTTRVRSLLAGSFEDARLVSDGNMVTLWREGDFGYESDSESAVEAVAEIVHHQNQALERLQRLPGAIPCAADGPWHNRKVPGVILYTPRPVRLSPGLGVLGPILSAQADCGRALRRFYLSIDRAGEIHGDERRLPTHARLGTDTADGLGACEIVCDGRHVQLNWMELEPSKECVLAGARLVARLSRKSGGLYR